MLADAGAKREAGRALLAWYGQVGRDLPWRRRSDPYAIWVSEVMLQQTRVDTVLGYYEAFLARFPDVGALAGASEEEVLAAWSGLGYYRRARQLYRAAGQIVEAGEWPADAAQWRELPGIGEYTSAAISSIAGGEPVVVLDGNVERVLSRLLASAANPKRAAARRPLRALGQDLLVAGHAGDCNQALMELGAVVCRPKAPRCAACPVSAWCAGYATGDPQRYPKARPRQTIARVQREVFLVRRDERYLLFRRAADSRQLAGFWELPWVDEEEAPAALSRKYGGVWKVGAPGGKVRHAITRRRFEVQVRQADWQPAGPAEESGSGWFSEAEIENLATSSLVAKVLKASRRRAGGRG